MCTHYHHHHHYLINIRMRVVFVVGRAVGVSLTIGLLVRFKQRLFARCGCVSHCNIDILFQHFRSDEKRCVVNFNESVSFRTDCRFYATENSF